MKRFIGVVLIWSLLIMPVAAAPSHWAADHYFSARYEELLGNSLKNVDRLQEEITREEFAELVVRVYAKATNQSTQVFSTVNPFSDTSNDMVAKAYNLGIVNGMGKGIFAPKAHVTREQIAVMLHNMTQKLGIETTQEATKEFKDLQKVSTWAKEAINYSINESILSGVGEGMIAPKSLATRQEAIVLANRLCEKYQWTAPTAPETSHMTIGSFTVPNLLTTQILAYNPSDVTIDLRLVSKIVVDENQSADIKTQQLEIVKVLQSNETIEYETIMAIADVMNDQYDSVQKRYTLSEPVIINGYYQFKIYGSDNLTIDCISR